MLTTAHELYKKGSQRAHRLMYHIGALLARERLACEDVESAHKLLESVAGMDSNTGGGGGRSCLGILDTGLWARCMTHQKWGIQLSVRPHSPPPLASHPNNALSPH